MGTLAVASLAGYAFARIRFRGQNVLFLVVLIGLLIPSEVTIVPLFQMFHGWGLIDTHWPLILVPIFGRAQRAGDLHHAAVLHHAARRSWRTPPGVDGLGRFAHLLPDRAAAGPPGARRGRHLHIPAQLEPLPRTDRLPVHAEKFTLPQALTQFVDAYGGPMWNVQLAAASMTAIPVLVVFVLAQRQFIEGLAHTGLK